ncbi:MAG TPA: haloacid dehalogenase-like hydrolase [Longimicrobium sp.]|nr:haloacid dehalogenase-like hydrolase [Longimicrobium sp.]
MTPPPHRGFASVVFDCDSTLARIEGIDELAGEHAEAIRALTDAAMQGAVPLEEVYGRRLDIILPTRSQVDALGQAYVGALVADARETVGALLWLGKTVRVVSGGLRPPVEEAARALGLSADDVAAVGIEFDGSGGYAGFERASPLARSGGKEGVIRAWDLPRPTLLVGDGATDLEARPAVDAFAAYMGVAFRPAVAAAADFVLRDESLAAVLSLAADDGDRERLRGGRWADLLARGDAALAVGPSAE